MPVEPAGTANIQSRRLIEGDLIANPFSLEFQPRIVHFPRAMHTLDTLPRAAKLAPGATRRPILFTSAKIHHGNVSSPAAWELRPN
jgi:hypothetical protein